MKRLQIKILIVVGLFILTGCHENIDSAQEADIFKDSTMDMQNMESESTNRQDFLSVTDSSGETGKIAAGDVPAYTGNAFIEWNHNQPGFTKEDITTDTFEYYSELDEYGRCGVAYANICQDLMPEGDRGEIGQIHPSGWHTVKYNGFIDGNYLYNRCHLIAYQLAGENANEKNLITGTRYMNVQGMLPFENQVADYVKRTNHHVLYRVTPVYEDENLVASGVELEAMSVEDEGRGICFHVFVYNVQPGIIIDYTDGDSRLSMENEKESVSDLGHPVVQYIINTNTGKFHLPDCESVDTIEQHNRWEYTGDRDEIVSMGYAPCKRCNP